MRSWITSSAIWKNDRLIEKGFLKKASNKVGKNIWNLKL